MANQAMKVVVNVKWHQSANEEIARSYLAAGGKHQSYLAIISSGWQYSGIVKL